MSSKILFPVLLCLFTQVARTQNILQLWYPYQLNVLPNCSAKPFEKSFPITTNSKNAVKLYSLNTNSNEYILMYNRKKVQEQDTISLTDAKPAIFTVKFKMVPKNQDSLHFSFETSIDSMNIFKNGTIQLLFKEYVISEHENMTDKEQIVELSGSCLDSIKVYFPFGGTSTNISLYSNRDESQEPIRSIWYQLGSNSNFMTFSKNDIGKYYVKQASCWGGDGFWLTIK